MGGMSRGRDDIWGLILLSEAWRTAPCGGWPTGQGCRGSPGLGRMASGGLILLSEAWWTAPCGGGEPPTKVGGLRPRRGGWPTGQGCQGCLAASGDVFFSN